MKKVLLFAAVLLCMTYAANAQVDGNAIGLRFGSGIEASYQHALSNTTRLEFDLGLSSLNVNPMSLNATCVWQKVSSIGNITGFNWYWGIGGAVGIYDKFFAIGAVGNGGIEYSLPRAPFQFSLDYRPGLYLVTGGTGLHFGWDGICAAVRYKF